MKFNTYALIAGGIALGLAVGVTIGVSEADDIQRAMNVPKNWIMKTAGGKDRTGQAFIPAMEIIKKFEADGSRITDFELDREFLGEVYELELVDTKGEVWDINVDAHTGDVISRHRDWD